MDLRTLEVIVRRLMTDGEFRARAIAEPSVVLSEYRLSKEETVALKKLVAQMADGPQFGLGGVRTLGFWM